jgi:multiple sugar transport system permease protein
MATSRVEPVKVAPVAARVPRSLLHRVWADRWLYVFLLPTLVLYTMYTLWPIAASYWYSLLDYNGFSSNRAFVGLANYREVFQDALFWSALGRTFLFMLVTVPIRVGLSLVAALILNHPRLPLAKYFRTALFLPVVTTTAIVGVVMQFVFDPASGPVNLVLLNFGLSRPINFLGNSGSALYTVMGVHVWKWFGITLIYWLAALQTVPEEVNEAAKIDGATTWGIFRYITVPLLVPFAIIILLLSAIETLQVFDLMLTMTGGGPFYSSEVVEIYIYRQAFAATIPRLGYASAAAVVFGVTTMLLALGQVLGVRALRKKGAA